MSNLGGREISTVGVGHAIDVDLRTGAASVRIDVPCSSGRNGFGPRLALAHGGSAGSPFGIGWSLAAVPAVGIDVWRQAPRYDGTDALQLGGDEIVPQLVKTGTMWSARTRTDGGWRIDAFRSRRLGRKVRIERWTNSNTGRVHFRTWDGNGVTTIYGARSGAAARIADPDDEARTFTWLPEIQLDRLGNAIWFDYLAENADGVDRSLPFEPRRSSTAQRYLKRIRYGNATPVVLDEAILAGDAGTSRWHFQLVLDYGDHSGDAPAADPDRAWPARLDAFTTHRPGFAVRTHRLCRRFAWFHDFDELGPGPTLVGALALDHDERADGTMLRSVREHGFRRESGGFATRAVPPLRFRYAPTGPEIGFEAAPPETLASFSAAPHSFEFVDLFGEGLAGILTETAGTWVYKPNLGGGRFGAATLLAEKPAVRPHTYAFGDLDRDGDTDLSQLFGRQAGRYELVREDARWGGFTPFAAFPHVEALGGRAQWVDLNGDGRPDIVVAGADRLTWFPSAGDEFEAPIEVPLPSGAMAPPTATADPTLHLFFADMTGDGLLDLVRVDDGSVTYWPMLGNGRFADAIVMDGAPTFPSFDPARLRFVDLGGTGTTDLVYLGIGEVTCWINACGNRLDRGIRLAGLPHLDNLSTVRVLEFLGDGRPCLVWTNPVPGKTAIEFLPLTTEIRPGLLVEIDDSRGKVTRLSYASSTADYLRDRTSETPWRTRLPNHPIVVARLEIVDEIGGGRSVRTYAYHDGFYDGEERELRGFGRVDVIDRAPSESDDESFSTPSLTRTWFHLGTEMWNHHAPDETYGGDPYALPPHVIDQAEPFGPSDIEDALRTLAGEVIRTELWSLVDGRPAEHPMHVQQRTLQLALAQPRTSTALAAFEAIELEKLTQVYEQEGGDPRVTHDMVLAVDEFRAPTRTAAIAYPRRASSPAAAQARRIIVVEDRTTLAIDTDARFELALPIEDRRCELAGIGGGELLPRARLLAADVAQALAAPAPHHAALDDTAPPSARLLARAQSYYWNAMQTGASPLGVVDAPALLHHREEACFARAQISVVFGSRADDARLTALGYFERDGLWWKRGAMQEYTGAARFFQIAASTAFDGARDEVEYDPYAVATTATIDAVGNRTSLRIDYHTLLPQSVEDANGAIVEVERDPLSVIVATTRRGHVGTASWGFAPLSTATPVTFDSLLANPAVYLGGVAQRIWYDADAWSRDRTPIVAVHVTREQLVDDGAGTSSPAGAAAIGVAYLDGFGRTLQTKTRVEPGPAIQRDAQGRVIVDAGGRPVFADASTRWRTSGHVVYDARQHAGRTFEPFFSSTAAFEGDAILREVGVATLDRFDTLGRLVSRASADGSFSRTTYRAWETEIADPNDTVEQSTYRALREALPASAPAKQALEHARRHAGTTLTTYLDPAGRECGSLARGEPGTDDRRIELRLDVEGTRLEVIDPRGLVAFRYRHDMQGRPLHEESVDAGIRWTLPDALDRVAWAWNARNVELERGFDRAGRPLYLHVRGGDGVSPLDHRIEEHVYGEALADRADAIRRNLLGREVTIRDASGEHAIDRCDPEGRPLEVRRRFLDDDGEIDWRTPAAFLADTFTTTRTFDGLGRPTTETLADGTRRTYDYAPSGVIARVLVTTPDGGLADVPILQHAELNARGQRTSIRLGNNIDIMFEYDRDTFRLSQHTVRRGARRLRDERYTYDPVGNLVRVEDPSQDGPEAIIANASIGTRRDFTYDAYYRLRTATGRLHQALLQHDHVPGAPGAFKQSRHLSLNNGAALERYMRTYDLDASGNLLAIRHQGASHSWTTNLWVDSASNRSLPAADHTGTALADPSLHFDAAGNLRQLDHLRAITWGWANTLQRAVVIARPGGTDDAERYIYSADRQRARRISTRVVQGSAIEVTEKLYLGDQELLRVTRDGAPILERWTTHVTDGVQQLALVHRWTRDDLARETDDVTRSRLRYQIEDRQRSVSLELDDTGQIISYEEHFPYGGTSLIAGDSVREVSLKEYRYTGKERDDATGLYTFGHRYYAPWIGRWLSPDPIGPGDDLNLYQFVRGDPVGNVDTTGLYTETSKRPDDIGYTQRISSIAASTTSTSVGALASPRAPQVDTSQRSGVIASGDSGRSLRDLVPFSPASSSRLEPTVPTANTNEIGTDETALAKDAPVYFDKVIDPWDNDTGLPVDSDRRYYRAPDETIEVHGSMPPAAVWAYIDPQGYLLSLKGTYQWAETKTENELRHNRFITLRVLMLEHGYSRSETREKIDDFEGDRFVLERYGYVENDGFRPKERHDNQDRVAEAVNRYMDDYDGPAATQTRMGNADAWNRAQAQAEFYAQWFEGHQYVNQSFLASTFAVLALRIWPDPEDQGRVTATAGFFANIEGIYQQHKLVGAGAKSTTPKRQSRPPRDRGGRSNIDYLRSKGATDKFVHDAYLEYVRPGAIGRRRNPSWASSSGLGGRIYDDFAQVAGQRTGFEANTTPWEKMTDAQFTRKMGQISADLENLQSRRVDRVVWFGSEPLPDPNGPDTTSRGARIGRALREAKLPYFHVPW